MQDLGHKVADESGDRKGGSKDSSRSHSPAMFHPHNPRRASGSSPGCSGVVRGDEDEESYSPYEACGSTDNISPYSGRATPPYLVWARDLRCVLEDYDGQKLFRVYLKQEGGPCETALEFHYAYTGLCMLDADKDEERIKIKDTIIAMYRRYIKEVGEQSLSRIIEDKTSKQISERMRERRYSQNIYAPAYADIENFLQKKHAAFVEHEIYLEYVQKFQLNEGDLDSPRCADASDPECHSSSSSTSGEPPRTNPQFLPTVQEEDTEQDSQGSGRESSQSGEKSSNPPPLPPRKPNNTNNPSVVGENKTSISSTPSRGNNKDSSSATSSVKGVGGGKKVNGKASHPDKIRELTVKTLEATMQARSSPMQKSMPGMPPHPYHVYAPKLPPSTQDSELQSMSSDADSFTVPDTMNGDFSKRGHVNHREREKERFFRHSQQQHNLESNLREMIIPRTQNPPAARITHKTPENRAEFVRMLTTKLEQFRREQETGEKLRESLKKMTTEESNKSRAAAEEFGCFVKNVCKMEDDTNILDYHMQQLGWNDSEKASPHRSPGTQFLQPGTLKTRPSPGSKSPDRYGLKSHMTNSYPAGFIAPRSATSETEKSRHQNRSPASFGGVQERRGTTPFKIKPGGKGFATSDTSGIESGTSSGGSQVSAMINPLTTLEIFNKNRNKQASMSSHKASSHKGSGERIVKGLKSESASLPRSHRNNRFPPSSFLPSSHTSGMPLSEEIVVGYYLPNEKEPYCVKTSRNLTLRQFKQLLPKKYQQAGVYKYFFKCADSEFDTGGPVQKRFTEDQEILPLWEGKVMAKVVE